MTRRLGSASRQSRRWLQYAPLPVAAASLLRWRWPVQLLTHAHATSWLRGLDAKAWHDPLTMCRSDEEGARTSCAVCLRGLWIGMLPCGHRLSFRLDALQVRLSHGVGCSCWAIAKFRHGFEVERSFLLGMHAGREDRKAIGALGRIMDDDKQDVHFLPDWGDRVGWLPHIPLVS
eukprot:558789-Rhodomonas_salina.1